MTHAYRSFAFGLSAQLIRSHVIVVAVLVAFLAPSMALAAAKPIEIDLSAVLRDRQPLAVEQIGNLAMIRQWLQTHDISPF